MYILVKIFYVISYIKNFFNGAKKEYSFFAL